MGALEFIGRAVYTFYPFNRRAEASDVLVRMGVPALPFVEPLTRSPDLEIRRRAELVIRRIEEMRFEAE